MKVHEITEAVQITYKPRRRSSDDSAPAADQPTSRAVSPRVHILSKNAPVTNAPAVDERERLARDNIRIEKASKEIQKAKQELGKLIVAGNRMFDNFEVIGKVDSQSLKNLDAFYLYPSTKGYKAPLADRTEDLLDQYQKKIALVKDMLKRSAKYGLLSR